MRETRRFANVSLKLVACIAVLAVGVLGGSSLVQPDPLHALTECEQDSCVTFDELGGLEFCLDTGGTTRCDALPERGTCKTYLCGGTPTPPPTGGGGQIAGG